MLVRHIGGLVAFEVADDSYLALALMKRDLIVQADARNAPYRQYDGYWDGAEVTLVRVLRKIVTKGGHAFDAHEIALAKPSPADPSIGAGEGWTTFSTIRGGNVFLREGIDAVEAATVGTGGHGEPREGGPEKFGVLARRSAGAAAAIAAAGL